MSDENTSVVPEAGIEYWGIDGSIVLYGVLCDVFMILAIVLYMTINDTNSWAAYHQTYINMIFSAFAPLGISWWIVLADDSRTSRTLLSGAIRTAGLGPFMLLWVGMASHLMGAKDGGALLSGNWLVWMFGFLYTVINILLIVMHYHLSPIMYAWIKTAPLDKNNYIDNVLPWSTPEGWITKPAEPVEVAETEEAEEAADEEEPIDEEPLDDDEEEDADDAF